MNRLTVIAMALLAGCATTPNDVLKEGAKSTHQLRLPPSDAAACMARNVENYRPNVMHQPIHASVRALSGATVELVARTVIPQTTGTTTVVVAHITPDGTGAGATVWVADAPIFLFDPQKVVAAMVVGC